MKKLFIKLLFGFTLLTLLVAPLSLALDVPKPDYLPGPSPEVEGGDLQNYVLNTTLPRAMNIAIAFLGFAAFAGIVLASITMLTSWGSEDKINRAKTNLQWSIVGFIVVLLSYAIISIVVSISIPDGGTANLFIPTAHAVDLVNDLDILLPSQESLIESHDSRVSLPSGDAVGVILPAIFANVMFAVALIVFVALMYGGVLMVIGRGNEDHITKAKNIILYATIALVLLTLGYAIIFGLATLNLNQDNSTDADDVFVETIIET